MGRNKRKNYGIGSRLWWKAVFAAVLVAGVGIGLCHIFGADELPTAARISPGSIETSISPGGVAYHEGLGAVVLSAARDTRLEPGDQGAPIDGAESSISGLYAASSNLEGEPGTAGGGSDWDNGSGGGSTGPGAVSTEPNLDLGTEQTGGLPVVLSEEDRQLEMESEKASAQETWTSADLSSPLPEPSISAKTAVVIDANSGMVLYEKNKDEKVYPASTTKIMTALLAIEQGDLDKKVKISPKAIGVEGSSIYLTPGEILPLRDLVYGLMLRSGNDSAVAIAEEIAGGTDKFVDMMNERAHSLGAKNTHFMNPNGLHDENHYTTSYDMALIARQAMNNPAFKEVAKAKSYQANRGEGKFNVFYNKNKVVYQYEGGTGIKIGYTKVAGRTLVAASERSGTELICVVMGAPNWFNDTYALMDYAYSNYEQVKIADGQKPLKAFAISGGDKEQVYVGTRKDVYCPVKKGVQSDLGVAYAVNDMGKAPVSRWQEAGLLHIYVDGKYCYSEPLYYMEDIAKKR